MSESSPPRKKRRRSFGFWMAIVLVVGGTLYPISAGPAIRLMRNGSITRQTFTGFYRPLMWVREKAPDPVGYALDWYANQFEY